MCNFPFNFACTINFVLHIINLPTMKINYHYALEKTKKRLLTACKTAVFWHLQLEQFIQTIYVLVFAGLTGKKLS
jgi:hypothetical protein